MSQRQKVVRFLAGLHGMALAAVVSCGLMAGQEPDAAEEDQQDGYIRAIKAIPEISEALEDLGVKVVSIAIRCPPLHKASVALVVTDKEGKVVADSGFKLVGFHNLKKQEEWIIRLAKIDPRATVEGYSGNIRWRMTYHSKNGQGGSMERWDHDWYHAEDAKGIGSQGVSSVKDPRTGKSYEVWRNEISRAIQPGERGSGRLYRIRLLVKFTLIKPGDFEGIGGVSVDSDDDEKPVKPGDPEDDEE